MTSDESSDEVGGQHRWLVSYADFLTLLFAFFTALYAISVVNYPKYVILTQSLATALSAGSKPDASKAAIQAVTIQESFEYDFYTSPAFEATPTFNSSDSKETLQAKVQQLFRQQNELRFLIEPGGPMLNALSGKSGKDTFNVGNLFKYYSEQLILNQMSMQDYQALMDIRLEQEESNSRGLINELAIARGDSLAARASLEGMRSRLVELDAEQANLISMLERLRKWLAAAQTSDQSAEDDIGLMFPSLLDGYPERSRILNALVKGLAADGVQVELDLKSGVLRLPESLLFGSGRADFSASGKNAVGVLGKNLMSLLPCYTQGRQQSSIESGRECTPKNLTHQLESILIEGHTDALPIFNDEFKDNWDLSFRRAKNTFLELIKAQPTLDTLQNSNAKPLLSFAAYAERRPIESNTTEPGRQRNRRIDLRLIMTPIYQLSIERASRSDN